MKPRKQQKRHFDITVELQKIPNENNKNCDEIYDWKTHSDFNKSPFNRKDYRIEYPANSWDYFNRTSDEEDDSEMIAPKNFFQKQIEQNDEALNRSQSKT